MAGASSFLAEGGAISVFLIDTDNTFLRKGAVAAYAGQKLLIPINMRDGSLTCIGKGNSDWNCSAPHG